MIFALLTLLTALGLAAIAGWFSIIGVMAIFAAMPIHALVMGIGLECGKLVTTSWLYRNWLTANWKLKAPLIIFTMTLMLATSMGVFGFLSRAHLEQGAATVDNSAKVERLDQQIAREKATIDDDNKVITQLDATINSYLGKDRADRSVSVRRIQAPQRKQLREDIDTAQKRIDGYSDEKMALQSEVRKLQLEVGPIRYIAELIYGTENNTEKNIESAVRIFTLLIVSTFDPLAVTLLIAANHSLMYLRKKDDKDEVEAPELQDSVQIDEEETKPESKEIYLHGLYETTPDVSENSSEIVWPAHISTDLVRPEELTEIGTEICDPAQVNEKAPEVTDNDTSQLAAPAQSDEWRDCDSQTMLNWNKDLQDIGAKKEPDSASHIRLAKTSLSTSTQMSEKDEAGAVLAPFEYSTYDPGVVPPHSIILHPAISRISTHDIEESPTAHIPHFIPQKVNEETKFKEMDNSPAPSRIKGEGTQEVSPMAEVGETINKEKKNVLDYDARRLSPNTYSWLKEFTRT